MKVTDLMDALSEEAYDAEMFALEIKHNGGDPFERGEAEATAAKARRDHRTLFIKALYSLTHSPEPDAGEFDVTKRLIRGLGKEGVEA